MIAKKSKQAQLEYYSKVFFQLGLALILFIVYLAFNVKFIKHKNTLPENYFILKEEPIEDLPITKRQEIIKPAPPPPPNPEIIEVVKDELKIEEAVLESTETDESESIKPVNRKLAEIKEVREDEEVAEDIPFVVIENAPVFPGCKGSKEQKKKCFGLKMKLFIKKNFNSNLAQDLGLSPGIKKIFIQFTIDKNGNITNLKARAPHKRLENEARETTK